VKFLGKQINQRGFKFGWFGMVRINISGVSGWQNPQHVVPWCHRVFCIWSSELRTTTKSICGDARRYCNKRCVREDCGNARPPWCVVRTRVSKFRRDFSGLNFQWDLMSNAWDMT